MNQTFDFGRTEHSSGRQSISDLWHQCCVNNFARRILLFSSVPNALIGEIVKMNVLKYLVLGIALVVGFSTAVSAQEKGNQKIPKENPPIVIAGSEKKDDGKSNDNGKKVDGKTTKPQSFITE